MKRILYILLAVLCVACDKGRTESDGVRYYPEGMGLMLFDVDVLEGVEQSSTRAVSLFMLPDSIVPTSDDLELKIYNVSYDDEGEPVHELYKEYASLTQYNESIEEQDEEVDIDDMLKKSPYMPAGDYFATVTNGNNIDVESTTNPYFADSLEFTIVERDTQKSDEMLIMLQNSIVRIKVTDSFTEFFEGGAELTLSTEDGASITVKYPLAEDYKEELLYVKPYTRLFIEGYGIKQSSGAEAAPVVNFTKSDVGVSIKSQLVTAVVDADNTGSAKVTITINGEVTTMHGEELDLHEEIIEKEKK